ncbi:DUF2461 domain-containing protein [Calidithermus roseus]|uniref:TIGR02453 family protein n=1 Tax=Calidithermus roseus TaxID=1644118 RepID=A0A399EWD2_9DEIN|nr:DUF2461 domain-containing protein [Calidithermus roseus]RIH87746.1 hypothetical protein Mrose_01141 [Calidithermus roseus]
MARKAPARSAYTHDTPYFTPELFKFLLELRYNNDRAWFQANKSRYEQHVRAPFLRFITDLAPHLQALNPAYTASERSLFRIYRDTRFSADKSPYKTHAAAQFRHLLASGDVHAPGFYLHLEPGESGVGGGLWQPDPENLARVRAAIARQDFRWLEVRRAVPLSEEDKLKRPPKGFEPNHPLIEDLKLKSFVTWFPLSDEEVCSGGFLGLVLEHLTQTNQLVSYLCEVLQLPTGQVVRG